MVLTCVMVLSSVISMLGHVMLLVEVYCYPTWVIRLELERRGQAGSKGQKSSLGGALDF